MRLGKRERALLRAMKDRTSRAPHRVAMPSSWDKIWPCFLPVGRPSLAWGFNAKGRKPAPVIYL